MQFWCFIYVYAANGKKLECYYETKIVKSDMTLDSKGLWMSSRAGHTYVKV